MSLLIEQLEASRLIVDYRIVGDVAWTIQSHTGGSYITSYRVSECKKGLAGGRSEGKGPHDASCPKEFLDKVTDVKNPSWRLSMEAPKTKRPRR